MTDSSQLTPEESAYCGCVSANRLNLHRFLEDLTNAVSLFELLERGGGPLSHGVLGGIFIQYRIIAAKEGAMAIYHFGNSLEALRSQVGRCPTTQNKTDATKLKRATALFHANFPYADVTRHAIAHAGEIWKTTQSAKEHVQKETYISSGISSSAGGFLTSGLFERTYSVGWDGKVLEVVMTLETIQKLTNVYKQVAEAFGEA